LLDARRWASAYYLAGYAVECGLKACILARLAATPEVIFDDRRFSERCWTHGLPELLKLAGLEDDLENDMKAKRALGRNWVTVKDWKETARYQPANHHQGKRLYTAITHDPNGVMQWIKAHW
jgi:hypothetical protein